MKEKPIIVVQNDPTMSKLSARLLKKKKQNKSKVEHFRLLSDMEWNRIGTKSV